MITSECVLFEYYRVVASLDDTAELSNFINFKYRIGATNEIGKTYTSNYVNHKKHNANELDQANDTYFSRNLFILSISFHIKNKSFF